jgi:hypothetical protein
VTPYAKEAADRVSPYTQTAAAYAHTAAHKIAPVAASAKQRGAHLTERITPVLDDALDKVTPAVAAARGKVAADVLPKISAALSAAAASPLVEEAGSRAEAALAAAKGELVVPRKKKGRWVKRLVIVGAMGAVAVVVVRKFLGSQDADWQAARPTTPYAPSVKPETPTEEAPAEQPAASGAAGAGMAAAAGDDPQAGRSAHLESLEANEQMVPDQPAEGGEEPTEPAAETAGAEEDFAATQPPPEPRLDDQPSSDEPLAGNPAVEETVVDEVVIEEPVAELPEAEPTTEPASDQPEPRYSGEGVYVGSEPPEGYTIKGNERSKKYHMPDTGGYARTVAEVWFNSEEAAQQAGFVRAQR